jgi:hypothetical protein
VAPHPRARALRITVALTAAWLTLLNVGLGILVGDPGPALLGISLCAVGVILSALYADDSGLLPRGRPLERWERRMLVGALPVLATVGIGLVVAAAASSGPPPRTLSYAAVALALLAGGFALRALLADAPRRASTARRIRPLLLVSARPGFEVVVGLAAIAFGVLLTVVVIAEAGASVQAFLPLVFAGYGVIHILVLTDIGRRRRGTNGGRDR